MTYCWLYDIWFKKDVCAPCFVKMDPISVSSGYLYHLQKTSYFFLNLKLLDKHLPNLNHTLNWYSITVVMLMGIHKGAFAYLLIVSDFLFSSNMHYAHLNRQESKTFMQPPRLSPLCLKLCMQFIIIKPYCALWAKEVYNKAVTISFTRKSICPLWFKTKMPLWSKLFFSIWCKMVQKWRLEPIKRVFPDFLARETPPHWEELQRSVSVFIVRLSISKHCGRTPRGVRGVKRSEILWGI